MVEQSVVEWSTCLLSDCNGVCIASTNKCLAHAGGEELAAALKLISDTGTIDARGVVLTRVLLGQILAAAPTLGQGPLLKDCRFSHATFRDAAEFGGVTFEGDADFGWATFNGYAGFDQATFGGDTNFTEATFKEEADFGEATFRRSARFWSARFKRTNFFNTVFRGVEFRGATFDGYAEFRVGGFGGDASFVEAIFNFYTEFQGTFSRSADFDQAIFNGYVGFAMTTFDQTASFERTTFNEEAFFAGAAFRRFADFSEATFGGKAVFSGATFSKANFYQVTFNGDIDFSEATFIHGAEFNGARFENARQFGPLLAYRGLILDDVQFAQPVQIEISSTGVCCRRARFSGGVQFRLRWARVALDDSDLGAPSILAGIPHLSSVRLALQEERIAKAWCRLLSGKISERPQLLSLRRANVGGLGLSNISADDCRFAGAHNLDKLRLESDVSFTTAPVPTGHGVRKRGGREVIAEERTWRANRRRRSHRYWVLPDWPSWLTDQPEVLDPGQIAGLYRSLRKGREDSKNEPGAANFYYGEMEMRRAHAGDGESLSVERGILTAYWIVSGYGLRAWRSLAGFALVTALLALAFHQIGFAVPPRPVSYWTSLLYAFRATLSLTDDQVTLTAWGRLLQGVLRLTGPVLLGLALLALRGRVKR